MEDRAQRALDDVLLNELSEPAVARMLQRYAAASSATLVVSASMPIRDLEWFAPALPVPPRVLANRGANGIDGVVSTALGVAASGTTGRTLALLGDLAFLHDVSGLVNLPERPCTFIVVDNGGGGIFSFLPQAKALRPESFETLFATPPTSDLGAVAARVRASGRGSDDAFRVGAGPGHGSGGARPRPRPRAVAGRERGAARRNQPGGPSRAEPRRRGRASRS